MLLTLCSVIRMFSSVPCCSLIGSGTDPMAPSFLGKEPHYQSLIVTTLTTVSGKVTGTPGLSGCAQTPLLVASYICLKQALNSILQRRTNRKKLSAIELGILALKTL